MAELFLYACGAHAILQQLARIRMPQAVKVKMTGQPGTLQKAAETLGHVLVLEGVQALDGNTQGGISPFGFISFGPPGATAP